MKTPIPKKYTPWKAFVVVLISGFYLLPGAVHAQVNDQTSNPSLLQPAYISSINDLHTVQLPPRDFDFTAITPSVMNLDVTEILQQIDETLILGYLENLTSFGPRLTGAPACDQAAHYIYQTFQSMGLEVRYHNYTEGTMSGSNVEATLPGSGSNNVFIICGHYDSVAAGPGADDDGSGVAAVLAAAEVLRNYEFFHTIRFVTFSGEEQGLFGSYYYAEEAYTNNDTIIAVLNADMIGFAPLPSDGTKGKIYENTESEWIVTFTQSVSQLYWDYIGIEVAPQGESAGSDHYSFWEFGYDGVFYHEWNFNDYYHSANDTIIHMNLSYSTRFTRLIVATLAELALQTRTVLEIQSIMGGLGVTTQVCNIGDINASYVNVTVSVTGGVLGRLDKSVTTGVHLLAPSETLSQGISLFRFGKINIVVTAWASNADQTVKQATGFLLGPFVLRIIST